MPLPNYSNPPYDVNLLLEPGSRTITTTTGFSQVYDTGAVNGLPECRVIILANTVTAGTITTSLQQADDAAFTVNVETLATMPTVSATQVNPTTLHMDNNRVTRRFIRLSYVLPASSNVTIPGAFITVD